LRLSIGGIFATQPVPTPPLGAGGGAVFFFFFEAT